MTPERERPYRMQNSEVLYSDAPIVTAAQSDIQHLIRLSADNPRKRVRLCAHKDPQRPLHEMLIIHERSAYVRPHRHPGKSESMHVISGEVDVVVFDAQGGVSEVIEMGDYASGKIFYYRMEVPLFHTLIIRSDVLVGKRPFKKMPKSCSRASAAPRRLMRKVSQSVGADADLTQAPTFN